MKEGKDYLDRLVAGITDENIFITPAQGFDSGVYDLFSALAQESITITAEGLLELAQWIEENRQRLEQEAELKPL